MAKGGRFGVRDQSGKRAMKASYGALQRIALLPLILFLWSGLADELLGWPGVLPFALGAAHGPSLLAVFGTWIEILVPLGLLISRTRPSAAFVLAVYSIVLAFIFHPFWLGDDSGHHSLQGFLLSAALSGVLLFISCAAFMQNRERKLRAGDRPPFAVSRPSRIEWPTARAPMQTTLVAHDPHRNWMRT